LARRKRGGEIGHANQHGAENKNGLNAPAAKAGTPGGKHELPHCDTLTKKSAPIGALFQKKQT
jgi:hypothetical protein